LSRLRILAAEPLTAPERFDDLYLGLRTLFYLLADETAAAQLGLPVLNGELFGELRDLDGAQLSNRDLLDRDRPHSRPYARRRAGAPPRQLCRARRGRMAACMKALLDLSAGLRTQGGQWNLRFAAGTERKSTGSYYTPPQLVNRVIQSALLPSERRCQAAKASRRKNSGHPVEFKVLDPACSGHFLVAAARALGRDCAGEQRGR